MKPGAKPHKKKPETKEQLVEMLNAKGIGPTKLAKKLGVTKVTIHHWINEFGIKCVSAYV